MEQEISGIKNDLHELKNFTATMKGDLHILRGAITGNELAGDGGMRGRIESQERKIAAMELRVSAQDLLIGEMKLQLSQTKFRLNAFWLLAGGAVVSVVRYLFDTFAAKAVPIPLPTTKNIILWTTNFICSF